MPLSYLAIGDSYTIGEQVPVYESFPYQTVQKLRSDNADKYLAPEIIAKTGWTTGELIQAIDNTRLLKSYDIVSLLIGVNNQYRGYEIEIFKKEFQLLLQSAIKFAGHKTENVFVLSIPDWGVTPFAKEKNVDVIKTTSEIDAYNYICRKVASEFSVKFIDITTAYRADVASAEYLAPDGLHPSGKEYEKWAQALSAAIHQRD